MAEELRLKTEHKPTVFNKDMLLWGLLAPIAMIPAVMGGAILAPEMTASLLGSAVGPFLGYGAMVAGGALGGAVGKSRLEKENAEGKKVSTPGFFNKKMVIGGLLGSLAF